MIEPASSIQYSIIIPVYNTTKVLEELQQRIEKVFTTQIKQSYEIIFVDDCSPNPGTWSAVENLVRKGSNISALLMSRNFGQHASLICGMDHAKGAYIITMDDDLQHAPEDIPKLIRQQKHDVVMGQFIHKRHSPTRNLGSAIKSYFDRVISRKPRNLRVTTFSLIRRGITEQMISAIQTPYPLFSSLVFQVTRDVVGVTVTHNPRKENRSGYSFISLLRLFIRLLINNLKLIFLYVAWSGAFIIVISLAILIGLPILIDVPNLLMFVIGILLINGLFLLILGIKGIGLCRIKSGAQHKPYDIKVRIN